jgi:hypothetical protein
MIAKASQQTNKVNIANRKVLSAQNFQLAQATVASQITTIG